MFTNKWPDLQGHKFFVFVIMIAILIHDGGGSIGGCGSKGMNK